MNRSALRVEWDASSIKEVEDAKTIYRKARGEYRVITDLEGNLLDGFRSWLQGFIVCQVTLQPGQFSMRILDETGDRRLIWNALDSGQVHEAAKIFNEYIGRGWKAYVIDEEGVRGRRIYGFDAVSQELFFDDKTVAQKLAGFESAFPIVQQDGRTNSEKIADFAAKFKQMKLLPRTYPG